MTITLPRSSPALTAATLNPDGIALPLGTSVEGALGVVALGSVGIVGAVIPPPPEPTPPALPDPAMDIPSDVAAMRSAEWALLAKKLERRIKAGKDPVCAFESDVLSRDDVKSVMMRLSPQMTVHEAHDVVDEVKALDDMTEDERRIYDVAR